MDPPPIRYALTADNVSIAYFDAGAGYPFLHLPYPMNHLQLQWENADFRLWHEALASRYRLVAYDGRGQGLSDRDVPDFSLDAMIGDVEAVVEAAGLERFALFVGFALPLALGYAARHPERVSHLVLWCPVQRQGGPREAPHSLSEAHMLLAGIDWDLYVETLAFWLGYDDDAAGEAMRELLREGVDPDAYREIMRGTGQMDIMSLVSQIKAPSLVIQPRQGRMTDLAGARRLVAGLPEARLAVLEGVKSIPADGLLQPTLDAIDRFIDPAPKRPAPRAASAALHTILFTDIEESTLLTDRLGDARARDVLRVHERLTRAELEAHGGAEVKSLGDGFMASFPSASAALDCAIGLQRSFADYNATAETSLRVRAGINAGEPIAEDEDLFGTAVIVAARVAAQAAGGEILITDVVRQLLAGKDYLFNDRGLAPLKGFEDPVHLFEVPWRDG